MDNELIFLEKGKFTYLYNPETKLIYKYKTYEMKKYYELIQKNNSAFYLNGINDITNSDKYYSKLKPLQIIKEDNKIYKEYENIFRR